MHPTPKPKIPPQATCVFEGEIFDVYQWEQELFDGTTATFEMLKRPDTLIVLPFSPEGDIYYAEQEQPAKPPFLSLFGGRSEKGEEPLTAAKRELEEETGLQSENWKLLHCFDKHSKLEWNIYYFLAYDCQPTGTQKLDSGEKITIHTTTFDDFIGRILPDTTFAERELKTHLYSAVNEESIAALKERVASRV